VRSRPIFAFVILSLFALLRASAQSPNGTISGEVVDPTGAVIVGADILAANDATGVQYSAKTNGEGIYLVAGVPPGIYRLQVSQPGFKTIVKPDIVLSIEDALAINFTLPVGAVSEVVTVSAGVPILNTTDGSVSTVVDQNYVKNMPLNGRSFQDLILLTPGSVTGSPQNSSSALGMTGEISINGQRTESNYYTVDGVSANVGAAPGTEMLSGAGGSGSVATASALGTTQALVSVDDLQEFRIQSSTYSAEYGRNPGGQFTFETKSGTNQWHGTAYDYLRNGALDANDWFNDYLGVKQADLRQNDFGGTLGGPLDIPSLYRGKDRTFFFVSYEGLRLVQPQEATVNYVPDNSLRSSAPASLQPLLKAFPIANGPDEGNGIAEFISGWSNPGSLNSTSVRLDHVVNDRWRLFFRFSDTPSTIESRGSGNLQTPAMQKASSYTSRTYTGGLNSTISSRFTNEVRLNYSSNQVVGETSIGSLGGNTPVDLASISGLSPESEVTAFLIYGGYQLGIGQLRSSATQRQWNIVDTASFMKGRHQLKFGVDYRRLTPISVPFSPLVEYIFESESAVESNNAIGVAANYKEVYPLFQNFSVFAEDQWKLTARLNLSMGLRWDLNPAPGVTQGLKPYTVEGATPSAWTLAPEGTALWKTSFYNFAPRLSAAYVLRNTPQSETVVRGGAGIFYDTGQQLGFAGVQGPGFSLIKVAAGAAFPMPASETVFAIPNPPIAPYSLVLAFPRHLQLPYTTEWNASAEQSWGDSEALTVSYVGSHGARLLQTQEFSGSDIGNPNASAFIFYRNAETSDYNALQIQFDRRLSQGLTALGSYTWSHCIDYGSQNYFLAYERGNCDFDVRNNSSGALSWDLPRVREGRVREAILNGWGLDDRFTARTAFPVTLSGSSKFDPTTGQEYYSGLNLVPGQPVYLYGSTCASTLQGLGDLSGGKQCPGGRAINPLAFTAPTSGLGDAPRNFARGFGAWQMDLAVRRDLSIYENLKLQFRAEAFNIFNHPNFGYINPVFGQNTFGQSTGTLASTLGILSPLYQMGGPRSMQFALKMIF
jgi:hypothetical protein